MASLLDPLAVDQIRFLQVVAEGWQTAREQWPVWQYVVLRLGHEGLDAEEIFYGLPTWRHGYRPIFSAAGTLSLPSPEQRIGLTIHGMFQADHSAALPLTGSVVAVVAEAAERQRSAFPDPRSTVEIRHAVADLMSAQLPATRPPTVEQVFEILRHEPASWTGLVEGSEGWHWELTRVRLAPFHGVVSVEDYLQRLESLVGVPDVDPTAVVLGPLSLVEELDHFALAWRLLTGDRILKIPRAGLIGQLTQPVAGRAAFQERCTALADLLSNFDLPAGELATDSKSLQRLEYHLSTRVPEAAEVAEARDAVGDLRRIVAVRDGHQHSHADRRADKAWVALGLARFGSDWCCLGTDPGGGDPRLAHDP